MVSAAFFTPSGRNYTFICRKIHTKFRKITVPFQCLRHHLVKFIFFIIISLILPKVPKQIFFSSHITHHQKGALITVFQIFRHLIINSIFILCDRILNGMQRNQFHCDQQDHGKWYDHQHRLQYRQKNLGAVLHPKRLHPLFLHPPHKKHLAYLFLFSSE